VLKPYGGAASLGAYVRAHYAGMAAKSRSDDSEDDWGAYNRAYVDAAGVPDHDRDEAAMVVGKSRHNHLWRYPIESAVRGLRALADLGIPIGVVSNAGGQIEAMLRRMEVCQVGPGPGVEVACVVDSFVVGVAKPDPAIFPFGLRAIGLEPHEVGYVGDSVATDVVGATAAGLQPILVDPFDDWSDRPDLDRITTLEQLATRHR
jgi:putative hydrolase of the HAD superfamily